MHAHRTSCVSFSRLFDSAALTCFQDGWSTPCIWNTAHVVLPEEPSTEHSRRQIAFDKIRRTRFRIQPSIQGLCVSIWQSTRCQNSCLKISTTLAIWMSIMCKNVQIGLTRNWKLLPHERWNSFAIKCVNSKNVERIAARTPNNNHINKKTRWIAFGETFETQPCRPFGKPLKVSEVLSDVLSDFLFFGNIFERIFRTRKHALARIVKPFEISQSR